MDAASRLEIQGRFELALLFIADGQSDEAIKELREVVRALPDAGPAHGRLGILLAEKGCLEEAVVEFRAALAADWADAGAHFQLAMAQDKLGHRAEALAAFESFLAQPGMGDAEHTAFARRRSAELRGAESGPAVPAWRSGNWLSKGPATAGPAPEKSEERRRGGLAFFGWGKDKRSLSGAATFLRGWLPQGLAWSPWGSGPLLVGGGLLAAAAFVVLPRFAGRGAAGAPSPGALSLPDYPASLGGDGPITTRTTISSLDLLFNDNKVAQPVERAATQSPAAAADRDQEEASAEGRDNPSGSARPGWAAAPGTPSPGAPAAGEDRGPTNEKIPSRSRRDLFGRAGGVDFAGLRGLDNPNLNRLTDFRRESGRSLMKKAHAKLASKNLVSGIMASKVMGQLKFTGAHSQRALTGAAAESTAMLGEQAFAQNVGGPNVRIRDADERSGAPGTDVGDIAGAGLACPPGWIRAAMGGCVAASVKDADDVTSYDALVRKAKDLIGEARKYTSRLRFSKARKKAREAERIGRQIAQEYGQSLQGEIIMDLADKSDEFFHNYGNWWQKHANDLRKRGMDPKLDADVRRSAAEEASATYR